MFITTPPRGRSFPRQPPRRTGRWSDSGPRSSVRAGAATSASRTRTWSTLTGRRDYDSRRAGARGVEVAAQHDVGAPADQRDRGRRRPARSACARGLGVRLGVQVADPPAVAPGARRAPRAARATCRSVRTRCSATSPRTRIALAPPPQDLIEVGAGAARARGAGSSQLREVSAVRALAPARAAELGGHHGGTSCSSATSHSQPASARGELGRCSERPARRAPSGRGRGSRSARSIATVSSRALPRHFLTGAELSADELLRCSTAPLELKAAPRSSRARRPRSSRSSVREAVDAHAGVVRGRHRRARRPPDGPARRRAAALARRVGQGHGARALAPRRRRSACAPAPDALLEELADRRRRSRSSTCSPRAITRARRSPTC